MTIQDCTGKQWYDDRMRSRKDLWNKRVNKSALEIEFTIAAGTEFKYEFSLPDLLLVFASFSGSLFAIVFGNELSALRRVMYVLSYLRDILGACYY